MADRPREDAVADDLADDLEGSASFLRGLAIRKEVLGADHVQRSLERTSEFMAPMQRMVTAHCWGDVWTRDGLDRRTRSLINLAMLTALGRTHEFGVHVRGAVRNGCTEQEIQEVLLQASVYCGVPAALESFRTAESVLEQMAAEAPAAKEASAAEASAAGGA